MSEKKNKEGASDGKSNRDILLLTRDSDATETIDLNNLFTRDVTRSGSFSVTGLKKTSFARLLEALPVPVLLVDRSGSIAFVNEYWRRYETDYNAIQGQKFSSLLADPVVGERTDELIRRVFSERKTHSQEGVLKTEKGMMWARMSFRSMRLGNERLVLVLVEDLTLEKKQLALQERYSRELQEAHEQLEQRVRERTAELWEKNRQLTEEIARREKIERALRESEERFRTVLESAEDWVFVKDAHLRYTHINPSLLRLLRKSLPEALGKTDEDLFPPEEALQTKEVERRVLQGQTVELEHTLAVGGSLIVGNFVRVPLRDSAGNIVGLCGIGRDVTERKKRELSEAAQAGTGDGERFPSPVIRRTMRQLLSAGKTDSICLFLGESGSGKDYLARYLHEHSRRARGPYFSINCAALPPELVESELFGHEAGAFTGSMRRKRGLLELAEGGTLLLNEIGELPPQMQAKLLSFLDTHSFTRVGGEKEISVNARILAATNRDLDAEVRRGSFRADLFYRLNVLAIRVPPLRERLEDIPLLVDTIMKSLATRMGLRSVPLVDSEAMSALMSYDWPGNIRELKNVLERGLILSGGSTITAAHLGLEADAGLDDSGRAISFTLTLDEGKSMHDVLKDAKRRLITEGLRRSDGRIKEAARILGISRDSFNHHVRSLGISTDR